MGTLAKGYTFGATELVTATKLHNLVDAGTISDIVNADCDASMGLVDTKLATLSSSEKVSGSALFNLLSLPSSAGSLRAHTLFESVDFATLASLPDISRGTLFNLYYPTLASLATFVNPHAGQEFVLIAQQASYPGIMNTGNFNLSDNWVPKAAQDALKLRFNGSQYYELARMISGNASGVQFKVGSFTRVMDANDGDVSYTGVGFTPRCIFFWGANPSSTYSFSWGASDGTNHVAMSHGADGTAGVPQIDTTACIVMNDDAGGTNRQEAIVKTFDADGFTLTWDEVGTSLPNETATVMYIALG